MERDSRVRRETGEGTGEKAGPETEVWGDGTRRDDNKSDDNESDGGTDSHRGEGADKRGQRRRQELKRCDGGVQPFGSMEWKAPMMVVGEGTLSRKGAFLLLHLGTATSVATEKKDMKEREGMM